MNASHIRQVVAARYTKKLWAVNFEVGLCKGGRFRADVLAINMGGGIDVVEVKSSVADFRADKKMGEYLRFADKVYLACTHDVYAKIKDRVLPGIGVLIVDGSACWVVKRATKRKTQAKIRLNILTRMAYRSADATLHARKSKTAAAEFLARKVVKTIQDMPPERKKGRPDLVIKAVTASLEGFV